VASLRLELERLRGWVNPADAFLAMHANDPNAFWFDRSTNLQEPVSVIGSAGASIRLGDEAFAVASEQLAAIRAKVIPTSDQEIPFSFRPGLVGYLGYELATGARESAAHPKAQLMLVDRAMVFDHATKSMYFIGLFETKEEFQNWYRAALLRLTLVGGESAAFLQATKEPKIISTKLRHSKESYLELIKKSKEFIARGDVYQLCLTNQITIEHDANALKTFLSLREKNPAPYGSYLKLGGIEIVSSSPEQFLKITAAGQVSTKPIKGTRPRSRNRDEDALIAKELRDNQKEQAENLMIVDLMRNDLGRVCEADSVRVEKLFDIESYATVHQLVSTVSGQLKFGQSATSALAACFPAGSMTGAPKLKAIEILEQLEGSPRDIYSGAIGYLGFDGSADFGMTIRTLVFEGKYASLGVGGGITIDSEPESELQETMLKAQALLEALGGGTWKI
jgi:para-aminobenzoate synthetase component I